jgi:hypothetical protein
LSRSAGVRVCPAPRAGQDDHLPFARCEPPPTPGTGWLGIFPQRLKFGIEGSHDRRRVLLLRRASQPREQRRHLLVVGLNEQVGHVAAATSSRDQSSYSKQPADLHSEPHEEGRYSPKQAGDDQRQGGFEGYRS